MNSRGDSHCNRGPTKAPILALLAFLIGIVSAVPAAAAGSAGSVTIAVVRDGVPPEGAADFSKLVELELLKHLPDEMLATFKRDPAFDGAWDGSSVQKALENALADPETDLVLATGRMAAAEAVRPERELGKPVVSGAVQSADLYRLPFSEGDHSIKENLSFIVLTGRVEHDLKIFLSMVKVSELHVVVSAGVLEQFETLGFQLEDLEQKLAVPLRRISSRDDADAVIRQLGSDVQAVLLTRLPRLAPAERQRLIEAINKRRLPSFSLLGHQDVEAGALVALLPDITEQAVRRVALNLSRLVRGESTGDLPVLLSVTPRPLVNGSTARQIGFVPDLNTRLYANFLHEEALRLDRRELSLVDALHRAEAYNTSLAVQDALVDGVQQDVRIARSRLLPQLGVGVSHLQTSNQLGFSSAGPVTDGGTRAAFGLSQMIYDDASVSSYRSSKRLVEASLEEREAARLDVLSQAGTAFLNLGLNMALKRIDVINLRLTQHYLDLATLRREVGYAGVDEVYRWESEVAQRRTELYRTTQSVEAARIDLNQILGTQQEMRWQPVEIPVDPDVFSFLGGRLDGVFDDSGGLRRAYEAFVQQALIASPEIHAIEKGIEAQDIRLDQAKRSYYLPSFFADLSYARVGGLDDDGLGLLEENNVSFELGLSFPLLQGGRKPAEVARSAADREALRQRRELARQKVEQRTRTALRSCENSFPRIKFSLQSAYSATRNLALVQDRYAEGIVNVTDLLSAQTQKYAADQVATASVYEFLNDLVALQRALSWFEADKTPEELELFVEQIRSAVKTR